MAQSVELLLGAEAEGRIRYDWQALHGASLPSEYRPASASHRPHITLFAGPKVPEPESELAELVRGVDGMTVRIGSVLLFGPRRGSYVMVRQVLPSVELLELQQRVASWCGALRGGQFGPGRWAAHVTLARRMTADHLPRALEVLTPGTIETSVTGCRRWDGTARRDWLL
ncbi:MAG TPA: 2'-5' RNA ligase family protein [Microlunatus sp.]|nr:2'-5' RNA ligase family protein [Microlunatus sp.]